MLYGELPEVTLPNGQKAKGFRVAVPNPPKEAFVALPTNDQMIERLEQQRSIRRSLGRGKSATDHIFNPKADLALFEKIRLDKEGVAFDEYEASNAVGKLIAAEATESVRDGEQFVVSVKTRFGVTKHYLSMPVQKDLTLYRRSVLDSMELRHGQEELRYKIEPAIRLYDAVVKKTEGYLPSIPPSDVPPHHKSAAVIELVQAMDDLDPDIDPNS